MRVLHVAQPEHSGVPVVVASMVASQVEAGFDVAVACPSASVLRRDSVPGVRLCTWEASREPGPASILEAARLARLVRAVEPEILHLHSAKAGLAGRLSTRGRLPTVFQPHAWSFDAAGPALRPAVIAWERLAARWADRIVCVSEDERRRGVDAGVRGRFAVIPNGIDPHRFSPAGPEEAGAARMRLGVPPGPVAVSVGRVARQKGIDVLLEAWGRVRASVADAQLLIVGDGPDRAALSRAGVGGVRWAGMRDDVGDWLRAADVAVLASRWEAGAPLAVLEAMACARSVVATDVAGIRDALEPDAGAVVPVEDPVRLAEALIPRLREPHMAAREGAAGRVVVETRFDVRRTNADVMALYGQILRERG